MTINDENLYDKICSFENLKCAERHTMGELLTKKENKSSDNND